MTDGPERKRRKLTTALKEAIGANTQIPADNIEKPIALALISDDKSAKDLLNKIQATRRPHDVLLATLRICKEKKTEAHVDQSFLSVFRQHFSILGIDSASACWKIIEEYLQESESLNEIRIANEFINSANILGYGFKSLRKAIKERLPNIIASIWKQDRHADALSLSYTFMCLILAEEVYGDNQAEAASLSEYWGSEVLTEGTMKEDFGMLMISSLSGNVSAPKYLSAPSKIPKDQLQLLSEVYLNHLEFFTEMLHDSNSIQLLVEAIGSNLESDEIRKLGCRIRTSNARVTSNVYYAIISVMRSYFDISDSCLLSIEDLNSLKMKEVIKQLPSICEVKTKIPKMDNTKRKVLENILHFLENAVTESVEKKYLAAISLLHVNISIVFEDWTICEKNLRKLPKDLFEKLIKAEKGQHAKLSEVFLKVKDSIEEENSQNSFVNRTGTEVIEKLNSSDVSLPEAIILIQGVHTSVVKTEIFDAVIKFVEEIPGGESLNEIKLYKLVIDVYGGHPLESLALQVVFSKIAADGWTDLDQSPGTEKNDESWFTVLHEVISLLETSLKSAKNSILKSYTSLFCQLFSQVLKNSQKFVRNSLNAAASRTLSPEAEKEFALRRHNLTHSVARLIDAMKRNESYFSMLTASIIGDAIFYGSDSLLAMSKLHSLADKNASGLLATNLPVVERTRYKKFLSTITRASKRIY